MGSEPAVERVAARFDGWTLLRQPLELLRDGRRQHVQDIPLRMLETLVSRPGELVTREQLIERLWPGGVLEFDGSLNTALRKLRAVLGDDADAPRFIETVPRQGYRFVGKLEPGFPAALSSASPLNPAVAALTADPRRRTFLLVSLITSAAVAGGAVALWRSRGDASSPAALPPGSRYRIAVLPFDNLSPDPANAFFAEGMHEEVLSTLASRALNLDVISRATMMTYRPSPQPVSQIARDLSATHVLEGTVRRDGSHVRVTLRLLDAREDKPLWADTFDRELGNAMSLQVDLAEKVAAQLAVKLTPNSPRLPPSGNPDAYDLWLKGTLAWQNVGGATWQEVDRVEAMFTRAIELDEGYVAAYADRARVRTFKFSRGGDVSEANLEAALGDIAMAQKLGGRSPHVLMRTAGFAMLVDGDVERALALIAEAERAGPLTADFLMTKAQFLLRAPGKLEESIATHERAARLDPANPSIFYFWTTCLFLARRPSEALRVARLFDQRFPGRTPRGEPLFAYTGSTVRWREELATRKGSDLLTTLSEENDLLRYEGRTRELGQLLARAGDGTFRPSSAYGDLSGGIPKPVAALRGWLKLLDGSRADAAHEGDIVLAFAQGIQRTKYNELWLRLLLTEAALFKGALSEAVAGTHATLNVAARWPSPAVKVHARSMAARILAWANAKNRSVELLEELSKPFPSLGPAAIVRDPLISQPLANHARYSALAKRLEAEITVNRSLL